MFRKKITTKTQKCRWVTSGLRPAVSGLSWLEQPAFWEAKDAAVDFARCASCRCASVGWRGRAALRRSSPVPPQVATSMEGAAAQKAKQAILTSGKKVRVGLGGASSGWRARVAGAV